MVGRSPARQRAAMNASGARLSFSAAVLVLLIAACSAAPEAGDATTTTTNAPTVRATTTTTNDPFAIYQPTETLEVAVEWTCDPLIDRGGGTYGSGCSIQQYDHPILDATNFFVSFTYLTDDDGNRVGISAFTSGYSPACTWTAEETGAIEAPLVDGIATYSGVLVGGGHCEGVRWEYENTWDDVNHASTTSGVINPAG